MKVTAHMRTRECTIKILEFDTMQKAMSWIEDNNPSECWIYKTTDYDSFVFGLSGIEPNPYHRYIGYGNDKGWVF